ncbi:MAG: phenylacetate--CoA ligase [Candidatus Binatia bacterium]|nr:MAG: phenylacetate--CoA ligase [Candidatus Binatia bacterium]
MVRPLDPAATQHKFWEPEIQTLQPEEIRALQWQRLYVQWQRIWDTPIAFFQRKFQRAGINREDLRSLDDLRYLPVTTKDELRENEAAYPPFGDYRGAPPERAVRLGTSTGTSGKPTWILWTRKDLEVDYRASYRARWRWGIRPGMCLANAHPFGLNAGGWHFSHGIEGLGILNVPSGPPGTEEEIRDVLEVWRRLRPDAYRLFGNVATRYAEVARAVGLDPEVDLNLRVAGDHPSEQYLMVSSGLEALPLLGSACEERDGAHVAEDLAIVEVIDPETGKLCGHGQRGHLVVTVLEKENFLFRYNLEDIVRWNDRPCPCGETHRRLFYEGRARDLVQVADQRLLPIDVALVLYEFPEVSTPSAEYQILRPERPLNELHVQVELADNQDAQQLAARLRQRFWERFAIQTVWHFVPRGGVPRFAYKAARVVDVPSEALTGH